MSYKVLLIEDDSDLAQLVVGSGAQLGITVVHESDGKSGLERALREEFDCAILDISLPSMNGLDICKALRPAKPLLPILFLSSLSEETEVVLGLELGADDYVTKPFRPRELVSRVRSMILRYRRIADTRTSAAPNVAKTDATVSDGQTEGLIRDFITDSLKIDFNRFQILAEGQNIILSTQEWVVLELLLRRPGMAVARDTMIEAIWGGYEGDYEKLLTRLIWRVRDKLQAPIPKDKIPEDGLIVTVRGFGYRWNS